MFVFLSLASLLEMSGVLLISRRSHRMIHFVFMVNRVDERFSVKQTRDSFVDIKIQLCLCKTIRAFEGLLFFVVEDGVLLSDCWGYGQVQVVTMDDRRVE